MRNRSKFYKSDFSTWDRLTTPERMLVTFAVGFSLSIGSIGLITSLI